MTTVSQVIDQMAGYGLPVLPPGHPILDGKYKRFGPKKKAWYILREMTLKSGKCVVTGAFGLFQGENRNTVPVSLDADSLSDEDRAEFSRKQKEQEVKEEERRQNAAHLAANRAIDQWTKADAAGADAHPYLVRKRVTGENIRVSDDGTLLVPMARYGLTGRRLAGLQKIDAAGNKKYNAGMDKIGVACFLGNPTEAPVIAIGEGYATCRSVRLAVDGTLPVAVAFDAGNIIHVAQGLRRDFPAAHLLFLADDDYQLEKRFVERLLEDFNVSVAIPINGTTHDVTSGTGEVVRVFAAWRKDAQGIPYIEADIRSGRVVRTYKYENAGVSRCCAASVVVGNASVLIPKFAQRGERKWTDFNDLHVEESLEAVAAQIKSAVDTALSGLESPGPSGEIASTLDESAPPFEDIPFDDSPVPHSLTAPADVVGLVELDWALAHCALVQGSTDVWDGLNKLRMKRPAFLSMVGKDTLKAWEQHPKRRSISPRNLPKTVRGVASATGGAGGDDIVMMLDRYTLLYGTKTVWDADKKTILGYDAMALARGSDLASRWLAHPLHQEKDLDKLVFDPTQRVDLATHINMFEGFPLKPKKDEAKAELVLELLYSLCASESNAEDVFKWVLCWLAYPIQHPGAKMQTALLFFGEKQGTGKSLFFEGIVKPIYGAHGATGGQHQLEAPYTMWRSQKLFVLFEEILSRQDKFSYFGLIKHMITGRDTSISQKFKDDRVEANHLNCVMLSNEFQAVPLEPEDRRFLVADVRTLLDAGLLARIKAALEYGLVEAFYAFLLEYPLGDFDPHTKPIMTASKQRVIDFGRPDWESFFLAWSSDCLDAPFCSCLATDLYTVFARYCSKFGFRSMSLTKFSELVGQRLQKDRQWISIGAAKKKLLTVFHVPSDEDATLSKFCERFRDVADIRGEVR